MYKIYQKHKEIKFGNIIIETGVDTDLETLTSISTFADKIPTVFPYLTSNNVIINPNNTIDVDKQNYFINTNEITSLSGQKIYIICGLNTRLENPILNIKIKRLSTLENVLIAYIGSKYNYNINLYHLGNSVNIFRDIMYGKHKFVTTLQTFLKKINLKNKFQNSIV